MADEPDTLVLQHLRAIRGTVDTVLAEARDLKLRVGRLEQTVAQVHVTLAEHSVRMDRIDTRLDRIELTDA